MERLKINKNVMMIKDLTMIGEGKIPETVVVCDVRENYEVDADGRKTNKIISFSLDVTDPVTFGSFTLKVVGTSLPFSKDFIENATEPVLIDVNTSTVLIRPYEIAYGKAKISISCQSNAVRLHKNGGGKG